MCPISTLLYVVFQQNKSIWMFLSAEHADPSCLSWVIKSFITRLNILQHDFYVVVPVRAGLFMVESQSMEQLMLDGAMVKAATTGQRHHLLTTTTANVRVAAEKYQRFELNNTEVWEKLSSCTATSLCLLPILGLNAQPVSVAASAWPEADAWEGGEGLQTAGNDGLLTGGCRDNTRTFGFNI